MRREVKSLKDGGVVSLEDVKLDELSKDLHLVLEEASYFKTSCKAAGRVRSIEAVGSDRYMRLHLTGTTNEDMLKVATAQPSSEFKSKAAWRTRGPSHPCDQVPNDPGSQCRGGLGGQPRSSPGSAPRRRASLAKSAGGERYSLGGKRKGGGEFEQLVGKEQEEEKEIQEKEEGQKGEERKVGKRQEGQAREGRGYQDPRWVNADGRFNEDPRSSVLRNGARSQGQSAAESGKESPLVLGETEEGQKQFVGDITSGTEREVEDPEEMSLFQETAKCKALCERFPGVLTQASLVAMRESLLLEMGAEAEVSGPKASAVM